MFSLTSVLRKLKKGSDFNLSLDGKPKIGAFCWVLLALSPKYVGFGGIREAFLTEISATYGPVRL